MKSATSPLPRSSQLVPESRVSQPPPAGGGNENPPGIPRINEDGINARPVGPASELFFALRSIPKTVDELPGQATVLASEKSARNGATLEHSGLMISSALQGPDLFQAPWNGFVRHRTYDIADTFRFWRINWAASLLPGDAPVLGNMHLGSKVTVLHGSMESPVTAVRKLHGNRDSPKGWSDYFPARSASPDFEESFSSS
jgi:hypothetical protein